MQQQYRRVAPGIVVPVTVGEHLCAGFDVEMARNRFGQVWEPALPRPRVERLPVAAADPGSEVRRSE